MQVDQNTPILVEETEQRPMEEMNGGPEKEVKVNEESKYASVVISSIKEDYAAQYHHTATEVSLSVTH